MSGISTVLVFSPNPLIPSSAWSALLRIESLSPKLMLSSEDDGGNSGSVTPMISADSTRVETDERRRWWEFGLGRPTSEEGLEPDGDRLSEPNEKTELAESEVGRAFADIEPERECERPEVDVGDDGIV